MAMAIFGTADKGGYKAKISMANIAGLTYFLGARVDDRC